MKTNKLFKNILGLSLIAAVTLTSCNKNDDHDDPIIIEIPQPDGEALKEAFLTNREEAVQSAFINVESGGTISGEQGTKLIFNANAFLDSEGNPVTGDVLVKLIEVYKKSDMLLMNMPTNGKRPNGDIETLVSGGEFFVNATKDGQNLQLNEGFTLIAPIANNEIDGEMRIFNGQDNDCDGIDNCSDQEDDIVWIEEEQNGIGIMDEILPEGGFAFGYSLFIEQFGWTNIDKWYSDPRPKTTIHVDLPEGYDNTNCAVYLSYDDEPTALAHMDKWIPESQLLTEHYGLIPIGLEVHFIFVSQVDDEWNYAIHPATIEENHIECFCDPSELDEIDFEALAEIINNLP